MDEKHIHCDMIVAWAHGAKIQYFDPSWDEWVDDPKPDWFDMTQYRVKPKDIVKKWRWVYRDKNQKYNITDSYFSDKEAIAVDFFVQKIDETMIEVEQ